MSLQFCKLNFVEKSSEYEKVFKAEKNAVKNLSSSNSIMAFLLKFLLNITEFSDVNAIFIHLEIFVRPFDKLSGY